MLLLRVGLHQVFIGGLAPDVTEEEVRAALGEVAQEQPVSVRLQVSAGVGSLRSGWDEQGYHRFSVQLVTQQQTMIGTSTCALRTRSQQEPVSS